MSVNLNRLTMTRALTTTAAAVALAAFGAAVPATAGTPTATAPAAADAAVRDAGPAGPSPDAARSEYHPDVNWIVCRINEERVRLELAPLAISDTASGVAGKHAADMASMGRLASVGSDGRDLRRRLGDAGLYSRYVAEHMLFGYHHDGYFADRATDPDPSNKFHKALTNPEAVAIGLGYADQYWDVNLLGSHRALVTRPAACTS